MVGYVVVVGHIVGDPGRTGGGVGGDVLRHDLAGDRQNTALQAELGSEVDTDLKAEQSVPEEGATTSSIG
jgi:hypothetical protein